MNEKLINIQQSLKAPKNLTNSFGNYKYRSCEDILEAVKPLLKEQSLTLILTDEVVNIGSHNYVKATASLRSGQTQIDVSAYAREAETKKGMDDAQITGAASSYARKYALNGLFAIDDTKDADTKDNTSYSSKPKSNITKMSDVPPAGSGKKASPKQVELMLKIAKEQKGFTDQTLAAEWVSEELEKDILEVTVSEASEFIGRYY